MPLPSSHSVAGRDPMPTTTRSAGSSVPSVNTTLSTCPSPRTSATPTPRRTSTPSSRCSRATSSPICSPSTAASGVGCGSTSTTSTPRLRRLAATSQPMKPAPTTTACCAADACSRSAMLSSNDRSTRMPSRSGKRRNAPRHQTGRDHQLVVAEHRSVGERHRLRGGVQAGGGRAQPQGDVLLVVPLARFERDVVDLFAQHFLGQRRPVVRQMHLVADDRDGAGVLRPAQLLGGPGGGKPAADDHDSV